jgi:hypothetical protein
VAKEHSPVSRVVNSERHNVYPVRASVKVGEPMDCPLAVGHEIHKRIALRPSPSVGPRHLHRHLCEVAAFCLKEVPKVLWEYWMMQV